MSRLLNGFSDVISRGNLTTNSSFRIDQRGTFTSYAYTVCNIDDYIADCWYISNMTLDYCKAMQYTTGCVRFKGYGKKNQYIQLNNKDNTSFGIGQIDTSSEVSYLTSAVLGYNFKGAPVSVECSPRYSSLTSTLYNNIPIINEGEKKTSTKAISCLTSTSVNYPTFKMQLKKDGEFEVLFYNFRELAGAFRNPPGDCFVSYADDLQRCERFYQTGAYSGDVYVPFRVKMNGTPSVTLSSGSVGSISINGFVASGTSGVYTWAAEV